MDLSDVVKYGDFGFRRDYFHNPDDIMSIYNARREVVIKMDYLSLNHQIKTKILPWSWKRERLINAISYIGEKRVRVGWK